MIPRSSSTSTRYLLRSRRSHLALSTAAATAAAVAFLASSTAPASTSGLRSSLHTTAHQLWSTTLGAFTSSPLRMAQDDNNTSSWPKGKSEDEWRVQLSSEQFRILRKKGTEMAGTGEYDSHYPSKGVYECAGCGSPLYNYSTKFKSGCGWPAFFDSIPGAVVQKTDSSWGMQRTEILCAQCGGHLGHLFKGEGFPTPTDERACVNSVSIKYNPDSDAAPKE
ncbi:hypothetical protein OIO90_004525 [Microbotryomycetes sp. JL221]|nr:hypothetical protein OIO90_004525 [Microbotryomycetes sp. JL221]